MKRAILILAVLLVGCMDFDAYTKACEAKGGQAIYLRNQGPMCLKKDAVIEIRKAGDYH